MISTTPQTPALQEIDVVWFMYPVLTVAISIAAVFYWHHRQKFAWVVIVYSLVAYAAAIALKDVLQFLTLNPFAALVAGNPFPLGLYYGIQTVVFEVGGAYLVASYAVARRKLSGNDAIGYGLGLSLWENGVLLGLIPLVNLTASYLVLSGPSSTGLMVYNSLISSQPYLFDPPLVALPMVGLSVLERVSSLLIHISWGWLALFAAFYHKRRILAVALPMGMGDALVPFVSELGLGVFEGLILAISLLCLGVAIITTKRQRVDELGRQEVAASPST